MNLNPAKLVISSEGKFRILIDISSNTACNLYFGTSQGLCTKCLNEGTSSPLFYPINLLPYTSIQSNMMLCSECKTFTDITMGGNPLWNIVLIESTKHTTITTVHIDIVEQQFIYESSLEESRENSCAEAIR